MKSAPKPTAESAWLPLSGVANARDVGGLPALDGQVVQPGRLYRSDNLQELTATDIEQLTGALRLRSVVDLRTGAEVRMEGPGPITRVDGVSVHHFSLLPEAGEHTDAAAVPGVEDGAMDEVPPDVLPWQEEGSERATRSRGSVYRHYLLERPDSIVAALRVVAESDGATLVHCAAGKDRTGVVVALALTEVGVQREAIVADYVATGERIEGVVRRLAASPTYARDVRDGDVDRHTPRPETMEALLTEIDEQDGGVAAWLRANGWTDADAAALRARLLDP